MALEVGLPAPSVEAWARACACATAGPLDCCWGSAAGACCGAGGCGSCCWAVVELVEALAAVAAPAAAGCLKCTGLPALSR
jgi:hypothetical protein